MNFVSMVYFAKMFLLADYIFVAPDTLQLSHLVWDSLKTLLFSSLITAQSHVDICAYHAIPRRRLNSMVPPTVIATSILRTLYHLSFVGARFGGMAADAAGLPQQKRAFFGSLDILSTDSRASEVFLDELLEEHGESCVHESGKRTGRIAQPRPDLLAKSLPSQHMLRLSRSAFILACAEQLVPCLSEAFLDQKLMPFSQP